VRIARIALVANRVKGGTHAFDKLNTFLERQKIAYVATLRDAQNYVRAYDRGFGIYELPKYLAWPDWETFDPPCIDRCGIGSGQNCPKIL